MARGVESSLEMKSLTHNANLPRPERGVFLLLGASGSGKGTLAEQLLKLGIVQHHISMGDLLRGMLERIQNNSDARVRLELQLSDKLISGFSSKVAYFEHCVSQGLLIPNSWTKAVIEHQLEHRPELQTQAWIIDGYPRRIDAADHLLNLFNRLEIPVLAAIHLQISLLEMQKRLIARGRIDDTFEAIENRFRFYQEQVLPTLEYLQQHQIKLLEIDTATVEPEVSSAAQIVLNRLLRSLEQHFA